MQYRPLRRSRFLPPHQQQHQRSPHRRNRRLQRAKKTLQNQHKNAEAGYNALRTGMPSGATYAQVAELV
ncbi:hypothetical protein, partial [Xanthomonas vasicola]|uniref:hypothetical protein n=1 Tax=Xanthomonas vasicola TaxID=56459 RepID=UPI0005770E45